MLERSSGKSEPTAAPTDAGQPSVAVVNPLDIANWDALVAKHASATFFHSASWARVLVSAYGYTPLYLVVHGSDGLVSALPLMDIRSWVTGKRGVSLPFTDECGILGADLNALRATREFLLELSKARRWAYFECRGGAGFLGYSEPSTSFLGHQLDLSQSEEAILDGMADSTRQAIRKAEQSGLSVEFSRGLDTVRAFHDLLCKTRKKHGMPPQPFSFSPRYTAMCWSQAMDGSPWRDLGASLLPAPFSFTLGRQLFTNTARPTKNGNIFGPIIL